MSNSIVFDDSSVTGVSMISRNSSAKGDNARLLSHATNTAVIAAKSILVNGGSEETALKTAKAAAQSVLIHNPGDSESGSVRSSGFMRKRKAKRQAEVVASMALVTATNAIYGNGTVLNVPVEWEGASTRSGVSHLSSPNNNQQRNDQPTTSGQTTTNRLPPSYQNGGSNATANRSHSRNNSGQNFFTANDERKEQQMRQQRMMPPPPPSTPPPPSSQSRLDGRTHSGSNLGGSNMRDETSVFSGLSRGSKGSVSTRPILPPLSPRTHIRPTGQAPNIRKFESSPQTTSNRATQPKLAKSPSSPRSPVKEIIERMRSNQERSDSSSQLRSNSGTASNISNKNENDEDSIDKICKTMSKVDSTKRDPKGANEDPIYFKDGASSSSSSNEGNQIDMEDTTSLATEGLESRDGRDAMTASTKATRDSNTKRRAMDGTGTFDSFETEEKADDAFMSLADGFGLFRCSPFNLTTQWTEKKEKLRTNHRGEMVADDRQDQSTVSRSATTDNEDETVNRPTIIDNSGSDFQFSLSRDSDSHRDPASTTSSATDSVAQEIELSSSSEDDAPVQSSFLETLERVVMRSNMPQSSKDKSLDNSGKGKDRRSGKSASSSSLSNRSAGRPREITTTTMRSGGNGTSSSNSHSNNHSSSPQNRIPDSLPAGPFASPRHDPDAVLVKKKKKGWMRGPKKFIKNMKRYAQEETDENETVQARA